MRSSARGWSRKAAHTDPRVVSWIGGLTLVALLATSGPGGRADVAAEDDLATLLIQGTTAPHEPPSRFTRENVGDDTNRLGPDLPRRRIDARISGINRDDPPLQLESQVTRPAAPQGSYDRRNPARTTAGRQRKPSATDIAQALILGLGTPKRVAQPKPVVQPMRDTKQPLERSKPDVTRVRQSQFQPRTPGLLAQQTRETRSPFEVIDQSGELTVTVRRSKLLRTEVDIYRTAVVDPQICDVIQFTPREISIIGKGQGATHVTFWFRDGEHRPITYLVKVMPDPEERRRYEVQYEMLEDVLAELFPDSKVRLLLVADKLIVRGQAKDSEEAAQILAIVRGETNRRNVRGGGRGSLGEGAAARILTDQETGRRSAPRINVINMLRVPGVQQVALRVKIAELNRSAARGFGVDLDMRIDLSNKGGSALFLDSMLNMIDGGATSVLGQFDGDDISLGIRYLQQHGVLRILSEPTLVTMSGRPATFVAGGEFAVPTVVGTAGLNAVTTDFRSFGAIISFLPVVIDKDRIRLEVAPEFSQINSDLQVGDTPGLNIRAVTTTVEMREGQTLAIAGLLDDTMRADRIGDVPLMSWLFGRRDVTRNETELIILVTPELVHAMEPEQVPPLPGFDVTEPTNGQFFLEGKLEGDPTRQYRSTIWPRLRSRYQNGSGDMIAGPFGHGQ